MAKPVISILKNLVKIGSEKRQTLNITKNLLRLDPSTVQEHHDLCLFKKHIVVCTIEYSTSWSIVLLHSCGWSFSTYLNNRLLLH